MGQDKIQILGIDFYNGSVNDLVERVKKGGLFIFPAAPAIVNIPKDEAYRQSLMHADMIIPDSGCMALFWNITRTQKINRISGLEFLRAFFEDEDVLHSHIFLVNPTEAEMHANFDCLRRKGFGVYNDDDNYTAPLYEKDKAEDDLLLRLIEQRRPGYVLINLGGGVQEKLGMWLRAHLSYKPAIICTGAAIAFITGRQANIPQWADKLYLGWLKRCLQDPKQYMPRYIRACRILFLLMKYGKNNIAQRMN